jgi:pantoate--beta-alanine ligase
VQIVRALDQLRRSMADLRRGGKTVALVPTMGALHHGHLTLVEEARRRADRVIVSIFVNPTQFGPNEDLAAYPRRAEADSALLRAAGCDLLWSPDVAEMYPHGFRTSVTVAGITAMLEGAARPGHFDGVATVVAKLFGQVRPDVALFGEKDYQQLRVVTRMAADLDLAVEVIGVATVRDADGLALSSRNAYLSPAERAAAAALPAALRTAAEGIAAGAPVAKMLAEAQARLEQAGFGPIDYVALCDAATLEPVETADRDCRLLVAARIGGTRLIDNLAVPAR